MKRGIEAGGNPVLASTIVALVSTVIYETLFITAGDPIAIMTRLVSGIGMFFTAGVTSSGLDILTIYKGVERVSTSVNTAVVNSRPLFVALRGSTLLSAMHEPSTLGGVAVLVLGLVLVAFSRGSDIYRWKVIELTFPLIAAASLATANVARRYGLTKTDVPLIEGIVLNSLGGLLVLVTYVVVTRRERMFAVNQSSYGWFTVTGFATAEGLLAMSVVFEHERVAIVDSIVATAPLFELVLAAVFLRDFERITRRVCLGVVIVAIVGL